MVIKISPENQFGGIELVLLLLLLVINYIIGFLYPDIQNFFSSVSLFKEK